MSAAWELVDDVPAVPDGAGALDKIHEFDTMLAEAETPEEVDRLRRLAAVAAEWARLVNADFAQQQQAACAKLRASRKLGQLLAELERGAAGRPEEIRPRVDELSEYAETLTRLQLTRQAASRYQLLGRMEEALFEETLSKWLNSGKEVTEAAMLQVGRQAEAAKRRRDLVDEAPEVDASGFHLYACDIENACDLIGAESIDAIITDPPYPKEYLPTFDALARFAVHALRPGGSLLCMSGQSYLPDVMSRLCAEGLEYYWTIAYLTPGRHLFVHHRSVLCGWKPVIWMVKGQPAGSRAFDVVTSQASDKDFHEWGQSISGMKALVEGWTLPGQIICDPFLGGGATAAAVQQAGARRFVGMDIDESCVALTRARLEAPDGEPRADGVA